MIDTTLDEYPVALAQGCKCANCEHELHGDMYYFAKGKTDVVWCYDCYRSEYEEYCDLCGNVFDKEYFDHVPTERQDMIICHDCICKLNL
jgi:hypothetical protein